jgi:hypothetical protein
MSIEVDYPILHTFLNACEEREPHAPRNGGMFFLSPARFLHAVDRERRRAETSASEDSRLP